MRAVRLEEPGRMRVVDVREPERQAGEVLLGVRACGICGSDLKAFEGKHPYVTYPRVLGHEIGAQVIETDPDETELSAGDLVAVEPLLVCGECFPCRQGRYNCCTSIQVLGIHTDGAMCERISVPRHRVRKPQVLLSAEQLCLCETISVGAQGVKRARIVRDEYVVVIGAGPIGLGAMFAARHRGARVMVSEISAPHRELARQAGADVVVDPAAEDLPARVREWTGLDGAHVVLEAVGKVPTVESTIELAAPTGRIVIIGAMKGTVSIPVDVLMRKEIDFLTTRNSCHVFGEVLEIAAAYRDDLARMITHRFELDEAPEAFGWLISAKATECIVKPVLKVS